MTAKPLTALDHAALAHRWIARQVATQIRRRIRGCDWDDLEAACWSGVAMGLMNHEPGRSALRSHLYHKAKQQGLMLTRQWASHGFRRVPNRIAARPGRITEEVASRLVAKPGPQVGWGDDEWEHALRLLPENVARAFELRFRHGRGYDDIAREVGYESGEFVKTILSRHTPELAAVVNERRG